MSEGSIGPALTFLLALAAGVAVANLYYAQPLLAPISVALGLSPSAAGLSMTVTQIGYGLGMAFVVPLGDRLENRRLIVVAFAAVAVALLCAGLAGKASTFLASSLAIGVSASVAQVIMPFASHLANPEQRGRTVGNILSGMVLGMMSARPLASLLADAFSWRAIFLLSAFLVALMAVGIACFAPSRQPPPGFRYRTLLRSMAQLLRAYPVLRWRAAVQFFLFGAFTLFWTAVPLLLLSPAYGMSQKGVAVFALIGVTGAFAAPLTGWAADKGLGRVSSLIALGVSALSFLLCFFGGAGTVPSLVLLVLAAILIDCGAAASLVVSQRAIFALGSEARSRLNGLFFTIFYSGGAVGSALGAWAYATGGWILVCAFGLSMTLTSALILLFPPKGH